MEKFLLIVTFFYCSLFSSQKSHFSFLDSYGVARTYFILPKPTAKNEFRIYFKGAQKSAMAMKKDNSYILNYDMISRFANYIRIILKKQENIQLNYNKAEVVDFGNNKYNLVLRSESGYATKIYLTSSRNSKYLFRMGSVSCTSFEHSDQETEISPDLVSSNSISVHKNKPDCIARLTNCSGSGDCIMKD